MFNELLFFAQVTFISIATIFFATLGKEALIAYISLMFVISNIFVIKQIVIFSFYATSVDAFIVGINFGINLLQEIWGKAIARTAIWISFSCSLFYMIVAKAILFYQPIVQDLSQPHFEYILSNIFRLVVASFISYLITQLTDNYVYAYLKEKTEGKYFVFRNYFSICFSQFIDTVSFSFLGLYGICTNLGQIIVVSYAIKLLTLVLITPWLIYAKKFISEKREKFKL